jgi:hypothetical protein
MVPMFNLENFQGDLLLRNGLALLFLILCHPDTKANESRLFDAEENSL